MRSRRTVIRCFRRREKSGTGARRVYNLVRLLRKQVSGRRHEARAAVGIESRAANSDYNQSHRSRRRGAGVTVRALHVQGREQRPRPLSHVTPQV
jgi:hypothetical protein